MSHIPVLLQEMLEYINPQDNGFYLDCTFGAGGYSRAILERANCKLMSLDQDPEAENLALNLKQKYPDRFDFHLSKFSQIQAVLKRNNLPSEQVFDGIVMDLGVSSMQLDIAQRGFSFSKDGPLDMRMNQYGQTAADFVNSATKEELADVIFFYGEEPKARKIASAIIEARAINRIETTNNLANIIRKIVPQKHKKYYTDPATKTFQAIRIFINDELQELKNFMDIARDLLKTKGRLVTISFHSLEDIIVKEAMRNWCGRTPNESRYSLNNISRTKKDFSLVNNKIIAPSREEVQTNPRSRSARLRAVEKIG